MSKSLDTRFTIDPTDLEGEWLRVPQEIYFWSEKIAELRHKKLKLEHKLEIVEAEVEAMIRLDPIAYNISKITEAAVRAAIVLQPQVRELKEAIGATNMDISISAGALEATNAIKHALPDLIKLRLNNLHSEPKEVLGMESKEFRKQQREGSVDAKISKEPSTRRKD